MSKLSVEQINERLANARSKIILAIAINAILPVVLYTLIRPGVANDATALAISGFVPVMRVIFMWLWRRHVDWIGVLSIVGFAFALAVSAFSNGNSLLLKVHEQLLTGAIGVVFMISALIKKPLLVTILTALRGNQFETSNNPALFKRMTVITGGLGFVLLANAVIHVILALSLSTSAYLAASRVVTWIVLGSGIALLWWMRQSMAGNGTVQ
jgi:hypothetical protein